MMDDHSFCIFQAINLMGCGRYSGVGTDALVCEGRVQLSLSLIDGGKSREGIGPGI